jgi:hypothetical protein
MVYLLMLTRHAFSGVGAVWWRTKQLVASLVAQAIYYQKQMTATFDARSTKFLRKINSLKHHNGSMRKSESQNAMLLFITECKSRVFGRP